MAKSSVPLHEPIPIGDMATPVFARLPDPATHLKLRAGRFAALARGDRHHLRVDRARLRGDLGAGDDPRNGEGPGDRRLGLAASSQVAERAGHRQEHGVDAGRIKPAAILRAT